MAEREMPTKKGTPLGDALRKAGGGNSYAAKAKQESTEIVKKDISTEVEHAKPKQIAQGKVRKQSAVAKIFRYLIADSITAAKERSLKEVLLPGIRSVLFDTANDILAGILFPDEDSRPASGYRSRNVRSGTRTSYDKYYREKERKDNRSKNWSLTNSTCEPDDIILDTRAQANNVLNELDYIIHKYGQASIATYYDIVGVTGDWTDNRYGWTSLRGAGVKSVREGFMIVLPPTVVLED